MAQPVAYSSNDVGDIMFYHEAIIQMYATEFVIAIIKEVNGHVDNGDWELVPQNAVPEGLMEFFGALTHT